MPNSETDLESIVLETEHRADACVIWLHGLGADGRDFVPIVDQLKLPQSLALRFVFPNAPLRPITINQGVRMPGWYDISGMDVVSHEDVAGIEQSSRAIERLVEQQIGQGIEARRILLAGFSQGGAVALHCGLRQTSLQLGGIMSLSSYLPKCAQLLAGHALPVFLAHGLDDTVVAPRFGMESFKRLESAGYSPEWHEYQMEHSVCMDEIADIRHWLLDCLGAQSDN